MSRDYSCRSWFRCWRAHCQPSFLVRIINWSWIRQILLEILVNLGKWPRKLACQSSWMTLKSTSQVDSNWLSSKSKRIPQHSPKNIATFSLSGLISSSFFLFFFLVGQLPNDEISKRSWGRGGEGGVIARLSQESRPAVEIWKSLCCSWKEAKPAWCAIKIRELSKMNE